MIIMEPVLQNLTPFSDILKLGDNLYLQHTEYYLRYSYTCHGDQEFEHVIKPLVPVVH